MKRDLKPFVVHEVGIYKDATYFFLLNNSLFSPYILAREKDKEKERKEREKEK